MWAPNCGTAKVQNCRRLSADCARPQARTQRFACGAPALCIAHSQLAARSPQPTARNWPLAAPKLAQLKGGLPIKRRCLLDSGASCPPSFVHFSHFFSRRKSRKPTAKQSLLSLQLNSTPDGHWSVSSASPTLSGRPARGSGQEARRRLQAKSVCGPERAGGHNDRRHAAGFLANFGRLSSTLGLSLGLALQVHSSQNRSLHNLSLFPLASAARLCCCRRRSTLSGRQAKASGASPEGRKCARDCCGQRRRQR